MISFQYLPNSGQIFFGSAYILLMVIALFLMVISYTSQMEGKYISISVALFLFSFMILQGLCDVMVILNRRWYRTLFSALVNSLPWILLLGFLLFIAGVEGYCLWKFWKKQKKQLTADAMKESLDNLPDGICFYSRDGQPLLVNHQMNRLSGELFGTEILNGNQFMHQLEREEFIGHGQIIRRKPNLMLQTDNQTVWEFHNKELVLNDNVVSELIASDVTEQYQMAMELEKRNRSLNQINRQLRIYNSEVNRITREQEILGANGTILYQNVGGKWKEIGKTSYSKKYTVKKNTAGKRQYRVVSYVTDGGKTYYAAPSKAAKPQSNVCTCKYPKYAGGYKSASHFWRPIKISYSGNKVVVKGRFINTHIYSMNYFNIKLTVKAEGKVIGTKTIKCGKIKAKGTKVVTVKLDKSKKNMDLRNGSLYWSYKVIRADALN